MPKVWNFGNTTVRNPNRLQDGLILLEKEFQGNLYGQEQESLFVQRLNEKGIIESAGSNSDWFGRKWRSAFVKLGFITDKFGGSFATEFREISSDLEINAMDYEVTPAGYLLINATSLGAIEDVFIRQFICHEIPSPIEGSFPPGRMKPFIFLLQVLYELRRQHQQGLNKVEIGAFLQLFTNHTDGAIRKTVTRIIAFREARELCSGTTEKKRCDINALKAASRERISGSVAVGTLKDYADTTVRYSKMTGLIAHEGSRIVLRENKINLIEAILSQEPLFVADTNPVEYLTTFYKGAAIPTDNNEFAYNEITRLVTQLKEKDCMIPSEIETVSISSDIRTLEQSRHFLIERFLQSKEEEYAIMQGNDETIQEIIGYLEKLCASSRPRIEDVLDLPSFFEWIVWRSFLAIDHIPVPIHTTRRFPIDEDMQIRHHASARGPDMIFEFQDFVLVVEVTLTTSSRQEAVEGEPVRRHVSDIWQDYEENNNIDVIGLFIAPVIDNNTATTFQAGSWYRGDQEYFVDIVPLSIEQFSLIIKVLLSRKFMPNEFRELLEKCLSVKNDLSAPEWKSAISREVNDWTNQLEQK